MSAHCGSRIKAPDSLAGRQAKCPKCGQPLAVPAAEDGELLSAPQPAGRHTAGSVSEIVRVLSAEEIEPTEPPREADAWHQPPPVRDPAGLPSEGTQSFPPAPAPQPQPSGPSIFD